LKSLRGKRIPTVTEASRGTSVRLFLHHVSSGEPWGREERKGSTGVAPGRGVPAWGRASARGREGGAFGRVPARSEVVSLSIRRSRGLRRRPDLWVVTTGRGEPTRRAGSKGAFSNASAVLEAFLIGRRRGGSSVRSIAGEMSASDPS